MRNRNSCDSAFAFDVMPFSRSWVALVCAFAFGVTSGCSGEPAGTSPTAGAVTGSAAGAGADGGNSGASTGGVPRAGAGGDPSGVGGGNVAAGSGGQAGSRGEGAAGNVASGGEAALPAGGRFGGGAPGADSGVAPDVALDAGDGTNGIGGAGAGMDLVNCDRRELLCRIAEQPCEGVFQVREIRDGCFGDCVDIGLCACSGPEACPDAAQFTCVRSTGRCSPYL